MQHRQLHFEPYFASCIFSHSNASIDWLTYFSSERIFKLSLLSHVNSKSSISLIKVIHILVHSSYTLQNFYKFVYKKYPLLDTHATNLLSEVQHAGLSESVSLQLSQIISVVCQRTF